MQKSSVVNIRNYCIITCCYLFFTLLALISFGQLYDIGKYNGFGWISMLTLMELVKYLFSGNRSQKIKLRNILLDAALICASTAVFFVVTVLLGADIFGQFEGTLMFSALLSAITTLPVCLNLGGRFIVDLIGRKNYEETILGQCLIQNACLTFLGSWLGAFVIPLDWDRDWQVWPIPCSLGALTGYFLSNLLTSIGLANLFYQKRTISKYKL